MTEIVRLKGDRAINATMLGVMNNKGGCGKTSLSLALGLHLARLGKNVLFIDLDPQSNLSQRLGLTDSDYRDRRVNQLFKLLDKDDFGTEHMRLPLIIEYPRLYKVKGVTGSIGKIALLAGSHVAAIEAMSTFQKIEADKCDRADSRNLFERFDDGIEQYLEYFDYIVFDTAPSMEGNILCQLAARTVYEIICPVDGIEAANGLRHFINWLNKETSPDKGVEARPNVLFTMMKYQNDTGSVKGLIDSDGETQMKNVVYRALKSSLPDYVCDTGIKERGSMRNRVYAGFGRKNAYEELCAEILARVSKNRPDIFECWESFADQLQTKLALIDQSNLNRTPVFTSPEYKDLGTGKC